MTRPKGVTILAIVCFMGAAAMLLYARYMFRLGSAVAGLELISGTRDAPAVARATALGAHAGDLGLVEAVLFFVNGAGLWMLKRWARLLTILFIVLGFAYGVIGTGQARLLWGMWVIAVLVIQGAIGIWILTYLFKPDVKRAFGAS